MSEKLPDYCPVCERSKAEFNADFKLIDFGDKKILVCSTCAKLLKGYRKEYKIKKELKNA